MNMMLCTKCGMQILIIFKCFLKYVKESLVHLHWMQMNTWQKIDTTKCSTQLIYFMYVHAQAVSPGDMIFTIED